MNTNRLRTMLRDSHIDGVLVGTMENVRYITGLNSVALEMFPHAGQVFAVFTAAHPQDFIFVSSRCEMDQFLDSAGSIPQPIGYGTFFREPTQDAVALDERDRRLAAAGGDGVNPTTPAIAAAQALRRLGLQAARIGYDEEGVRADVLDQLRHQLPSAQLIPVGGLLRRVRKVKTAAEIQSLTSAAGAAESAIIAALTMAEAGCTEKDLVVALEMELARHGARPRFSLIKIGADAVAGQTRPTDRPLASGDAIWFDIGCTLDGYWADIARTSFFGGPSTARHESYYQAMRAGVDAAFASAKPGMTGAQLYDLTVEAVRSAGVPHYRRNHVGHGIGVEVYDPVLIRPDSVEELELGTVVNIETPYYEFGFGAVHIEDPFVLSESGNRWLTTLSRDILDVSEFSA
jgi:Xaa-Pro dipeptidase